MQAGRQKVFAFSFVSILIFSILAIGLPRQKAFADGFTAETFSASLGNRKAELLVKVNPPILTDESRKDAYMLLRLYDANTNQTIQGSTFVITVEKGVGENAKKLLTDTFFSQSGLLQLKIQPTEGEAEVLATREPILGAAVADPGGIVSIKGPMFLEGGIYHLRIDILSIDGIRNFFPPDKIPEFDSWLSVGDVLTESVDYKGQPYNTTLISYYDKVRDFNFDAQKQKFTWDMPFDWNATRIKSTNVFVHEELRIPKSLSGIGNSPYFIATANGDVLTGRKLAIDPYSFEDQITLHYLLNKNDVLDMAKKANGNSQMTFSLVPTTEVPLETTSEMVTDTGGLGVGVEWTPNPLNADKESTVKLSFSDAFTGGSLNADVLYSLNIIDKDGKQIYSKHDLTAKGGADTQTIDFPSNDKYTIQVAVKGITKDGQSVDNTRTGVARGMVIVPEFPIGAIVAAAGVIGAVVTLQRFTRKPSMNL